MNSWKWNGHWHGYVWTGATLDFYEEKYKRPSRHNPSHTQDFLVSSLPPNMTGHRLWKRKQAAAERTWTTVEDVLEWAEKQCLATPKAARSIFEPERWETWVAYACRTLLGGGDVVWSRDFNSQASSRFHLSVVCCPNRFQPDDVPCPFPPS